MTKEELAAKLNGRQYTREITPDEAKEAKANGLVVIYGASDDLCELEGAINEELGAYEECLILIKDGKLLPEIDEDDMDVLKKYDALGPVLKMHEGAAKIRAHFGKDPKWSWTFETEAPHATFEIFDNSDDDEGFCRGIVIDLKDLELEGVGVKWN